MNIIATDKELQAIIRSIIMTGSISVYNDPSGTLKDYDIRMPDDTTLNLEISPTSGNGKNHYFEYSIWLNDVEIANIVVPRERKIYSPEEEIVLSFFEMCSNRVIWQEMQSRLQNTFIGTASKQYNN